MYLVETHPNGCCFKASSLRRRSRRAGHFLSEASDEEEDDDLHTEEEITEKMEDLALAFLSDNSIWTRLGPPPPQQRCP